MRSLLAAVLLAVPGVCAAERYTLKDAGDKIPAETKTKFETELATAKKELESGDTDRMKASLENLSKIGAELYQQTQAASAAAGAAAGAQPEAGEPAAAAAGTAKKASGHDGKVVDADVEIVDEEKK